MFGSCVLRTRWLGTALVAVAAFAAGPAAHAASLITGVTLTAEARPGVPARPNPASLCRGEVLEVVVSTTHPTIAGGFVGVAIDGYPGPRRFLQWGGDPGDRLVTIAASTADGIVESLSLPIRIDACELSQVPRLTSRGNPYRPYEADFVVANAAALGPDFNGYHWHFGDGDTAFSAESFVSHDYSRSMLGTTPYRTFLVQLATQPFVNGVAPANSLVRRTTVTVGDPYFFSKQKGILQPPVVHDSVLERRGEQLVGAFSIRNLERDHLVFQYAELEQLPCDTTADSSRSQVLPSDVLFQGGLDLLDPEVANDPAVAAAEDVRNSIAWLPGDAVVVPPTWDPDQSASWLGGKSSGAGGDEGGLEREQAAGKGQVGVPTFPPIPPPSGPDSGFLVLPAESTHSGHLTLAARDFDPAVCAIAYHLLGESLGGQRVYASLYYEVQPNPATSGKLKDPALATFLYKLIQLGLVADSTHITHEDLYRLERTGKVRRTAAGWEVN